jgi:hypothetical protein
LCGGSERQPEQSKHYCSDHYFLPVVQNSFLCGLLGSPPRPASLKMVATGITAIATIIY